jgi:ABC-type nitrate/sulfonate/bicarbonate transport system substrate-binding protein
MLSRRAFLGGAAAGACLLVGCASPTGPAPAPASAPAASGPGPAAPAAATARPLQRVRVFHVGQAAHHGPLWTAKEAGSFAKYGLDVEVTLITGAPRLQQALVAGEAEYGLTGGPPVIAATLSGAATPIIAEVVALPIWYLVVRPEITRIEDLRGKRVGISQFGGALDYVTRKALRTWGLEPDRDVAVLQIGSTQEIFAAMSAGGVDAGPMAAPLHIRAQHEGYRVLVDLADTGVLYPQTVLTATRAHLQAHEAQTLDFLRGLAEGTRRYKTDQAFALEILAKYSGETDPDDLLVSWQAAAKVLKDVPTVAADGVRGVLDDLATTRPEARDARVEDVAEERYVRQLEAEGFYARLAAGAR